MSSIKEGVRSTAMLLPTQIMRTLAFTLRAALIVSVTWLAACSSTRLLYDNLDWLLYRGLDQRFDINAQQRPWVKERLGELHQWHRETQLPRYGESLRALAHRYLDGFGLDDIHWLDGVIETHRQALVAKLIPDFASFLSTLHTKQIEHFADYTTATLEEAAEPLALADDDRLDHRFDEFAAQLTRWTGDLNRDQAAALRRDLAQWPDFRRAWVEQRRIRQRTFVELLRSNPTPSVIEGYLSDHWLDLRTSYPQAYWASRQAAKLRLFQVLWKTEQRLSPRQRTHVLKRIEEYADDIRRLTRGQQT